MTYPKFYTFDFNRRIYRKTDGISGAPIYAEHFEEVVVTGENDKEYLVERGVINKRSMKYAPFSWSKERYVLYTEAEREAMIWEHEHRPKIMRKAERVRDVGILKQIAALVGYEEA